MSITERPKPARNVFLQRPAMGPEELAAVGKVFETRWLGMGSKTKEFEQKVGAYLGAENVVAVSSGTAALHLALDCVGIKQGDEVIIPSMTFVASVQAITVLGAKPIFCDIRPHNLNLDLNDVQKKITSRTKAIMPVHFGGVPCDMDRLMSMAQKYGIRVVEDAAHAFGSKYKGRMIGSLGDVTCFSFDPIKNITCGEGGAVVTKDSEVAAKAQIKRILGINNDTWTRYKGRRNYIYEVEMGGYRYHMSDINAAIGLAQLDKIAQFQAKRQDVVRRYDEAFDDIEGVKLLERGLPDVFPFFYVIRVQNGKRDELIASLKPKGIFTGVHYIPNHFQPYFKELGLKLPETEKAFEEILTLPLYVEMSDEDVEYVIEAVRDFFRS